VTVSLATSGTAVAATVNEITFDEQALSLDTSTCRINPVITKSLIVAVIGEVTRFLVQSSQNTRPIPDGPLYTCTFRILPFALPGTYRLENGNTIAFSPAGIQLNTGGADGFITVSLVPLACGGDCNGNRDVTVDELLKMVNIALGSEMVGLCEAGDRNGDSIITVDEILTAVNNALNGCGG
jgi:hypothetical protein